MRRLGPFALGPNDTLENGVYVGDARLLAEAIPDESVDLIFTDPIYDRIDDYRWLAETAARVLRPDSACLAWAANRRQRDAANAMSEYLAFERVLTLFMSGVTVGSYIGKVFVKTTPCLWMKKGNGQPRRVIWDISIGISNRAKYGEFHEWGKDPQTTARWLDAFASADAIILDPFTGGGTVPAVCKMLGRRYLAFEIEPDVAERARERVRNTQPPLFVAEPEQQPLLPG